MSNPSTTWLLTCSRCGETRSKPRFAVTKPAPVCIVCDNLAREIAALKADPAWPVVTSTFDCRNGEAVLMVRAVIEALIEGRCDPELAKRIGAPTGEHICPVCGMRHWNVAEAEICCAPLEPGKGSVDTYGWQWPAIWSATDEQLNEYCDRNAGHRRKGRDVMRRSRIAQERRSAAEATEIPAEICVDPEGFQEA